MDSLFSFLIRSILVSGLLTAYYLMALRGRRMHGFNRFYLLSAFVLALLLPLLRFNWHLFATSGVVVQRVLYTAISPVPTSAIAWEKIALGGSVLVSLGLLLSTAVRIARIYRLKRRSVCTPMDGYELVETEAPGTPFSFLRNLFWRQGADIEEPVNQKMLTHELAHIRGRHSLDVLLAQSAVCIFWMNPFFWFLRRELDVVLEFAADAASGAEGDPEMLARMLLQAYHGGRMPHLSNGFFHSPIKRRIVMITNNTRPVRAWMRKALALPVLAAAVLFFSCDKQQQPVQKTDRLDQQKLMAEQAQIKILGLDSVKRMIRVRFLRMTGSKATDEQKERSKLFMDTLMTIYYKPGVPQQKD